MAQKPEADEKDSRGREVDKMSYHPNYFQQGAAVRSGCQHRLDIIRSHVQSGSLLDIGCSEGFYSFGLSDRCKPILAIDKEQSLIQTCKTISKSHNVNIDFQCMGVDKLLQLVGTWDICLYMSVHHHIIAQLGMQTANDILKQLSKKCNCMFFDVGQKNEHNCTGHRWWQLLPPNTNQEAWLLDYLANYTIYTHCQIIGSSTVHNVKRLLWKLTK